MPASTGSLMVNVFDGTRQPIDSKISLLVRVLDGNQAQVFSDYVTGPSIRIGGLPIYDNFGDSYCIWVSADGYEAAGFYPIKMAANVLQSIDIMLLPSDGGFNFRNALWRTLKQTHPNLATLLATGASTDAVAEDRYSQLLENEPESLASFLNLATAMSSIELPVGTPLAYLKGIVWDDTLGPDRFFGWADPKLIDQIITATKQGEFAPEIDPSIFHGTATRSWKQIQFGEANVQLTFHEKDDTLQIDGVTCVKIEPDIDYYKDLTAHFLLEVVVNSVSHSLTDPKQVYVLRWIAGRHAGVPEFDPPYVIE